MQNAKGKIGVFDSGFGGLSILKEIVEVLPQYDYVYLGDSARAPYGPRSQDEVLKFTTEGVEFLFSYGAEIVILACNTASSEALRKIQQEYLPAKYPTRRVLGMIFPACEEAVLRTQNKKVGVLGTDATISSHAFKRELEKLDSQIEVHEVAAPLLVPLVEMGEEKSESAKNLISKYLAELPEAIDTLVLGCTHYGFLVDDIRKAMPTARVISEGDVVGGKLRDYLFRHTEIEGRLSKNHSLDFLTTGEVNIFDSHGSRFFGTEIKSQKVNL